MASTSTCIIIIIIIIITSSVSTASAASTTTGPEVEFQKKGRNCIPQSLASGNPRQASYSSLPNLRIYFRQNYDFAWFNSSPKYERVHEHKNMNE